MSRCSLEIKNHLTFEINKLPTVVVHVHVRNENSILQTICITANRITAG